MQTPDRQKAERHRLHRRKSGKCEKIISEHDARTGRHANTSRILNVKSDRIRHAQVIVVAVRKHDDGKTSRVGADFETESGVR
jgi:hypothetical protein